MSKVGVVLNNPKVEADTVIGALSVRFTESDGILYLEDGYLDDVDFSTLLYFKKWNLTLDSLDARSPIDNYLQNPDSKYSMYQIMAMDVDRSGKIDAEDITAVLNYAKGEEFYGNPWSFYPDVEEMHQLSHYSVLDVQDFLGVVDDGIRDFVGVHLGDAYGYMCD